MHRHFFACAESGLPIGFAITVQPFIGSIIGYTCSYERLRRSDVSDKAPKAFCIRFILTCLVGVVLDH